MDIRTHSNYVAYQNTITFVYIKAARDVMPDVDIEIDNSLNKGFYTLPSKPVTQQQVDAISSRMEEIIAADLPITKEGEVYRLDDLCDYFYGGIAPSTGCAKLFELRKYAEGILLRFPYPTDPDAIPEYIDDKNLHVAFSEAKKWQQLLGVNYMPDLNAKIAEGKAKELILLSEALHEKKIAEMADLITEGKKRIILIAGPSSSGKTTTAKRLSVQLRVNGLDPLYMGTDDYFVERHQTPLDEDGTPDYEGLGALDIELFNSNMNDLLAGKEVDLPEFDFVNGTKVFGKRIMSIREDQPIIIEGIHALNDKLTEFIPKEEKFKIYISPFTQLNIDMHNRVPTTDARMLRRMVRDYKYRGKSAAGTLGQWAQVRAGEDENIFPFNGEADVVFNTVLTYELAVLKKYAQPLLEEITEDQPEYGEACRVLELIKGFDVIEDEKTIPNNSILREFIGGSIFVE